MPNTPPWHRQVPRVHSRVRPGTQTPRQPIHHHRPPHLPGSRTHPRPLVQGMRHPTLHRRRPPPTRTMAAHRTRLRSKRPKARPRFVQLMSLKQDSTNSKRLVKSKPRTLKLTISKRESQTVNCEPRSQTASSPRSRNKKISKTFSKNFPSNS